MTESLEQQLKSEPYVRQLYEALLAWREHSLIELDGELSDFIEANPDDSGGDIVFDAIERLRVVDDLLADWAMNNSGYLSPIQDMRDFLSSQGFYEGRGGDYYVGASLGKLIVSQSTRDVLKLYYLETGKDRNDFDPTVGRDRWETARVFLLVRED